ncbi:hypothetical protein CAEBREN_31975 [Caenorhabditis brenneri]|uniref:G protein-coupled receptor n=1 Tax=Caenorhabditis brenneri TaxID=135651 RepID=G0N8M6_CAEBE|nr:hypothetical protein CAEBREN_31975 [Caenorhabditis brenneri]
MGQLYPGVDPFAVLFLINVYRRTLFNWICLRSISLRGSSIKENSHNYEFHNVNGTRVFDKLNMIGIIHHLFIIVSALFIVLFCGISIYYNAKKQENTSSKTRLLQLQLFRALIFQTLIPCIFNFIPLTFLYLCPILDIQLGPRTNYQVIMAQIYPAMDPIVLFFVIEDYRSSLLGETGKV